MTARKGFTLVELLLVVLILGILASIVVPRMTGAAAAAKTAKCDANWANLIRALELYAVYNDGAYPTSNADFQRDVLESETYFPHGIPVCPYGDDYVYVETPGQETVNQHIH